MHLSYEFREDNNEEIAQDVEEKKKRHLKVKDKQKAALNHYVNTHYQRLNYLLETELSTEELILERFGNDVVVRVNESASFDPGRDKLNKKFHKVLDNIAVSARSMSSNIIVSGHTDNIPIATKRYRSNWELSSARAVSVVHGLLRTGLIDRQRVTVVGLADTQPLVSNDTVKNRSLNRRVEIKFSFDESIFDDAFEKLEPEY